VYANFLFRHNLSFNIQYRISVLKNRFSVHLYYIMIVYIRQASHQDFAAFGPCMSKAAFIA
jgi:hypothetical protein